MRNTRPEYDVTRWRLSNVTQKRTRRVKAAAGRPKAESEGSVAGHTDESNVTGSKGAAQRRGNQLPAAALTIKSMISTSLGF